MALQAHLESHNRPITHQQIEGRCETRYSLMLETSGVLPNGGEANVCVHNISAAGLLIETDLTLVIGEGLSLDLPQIGPVEAEIVWQSGRLFGCSFEPKLDEAAFTAALPDGVSFGVADAATADCPPFEPARALETNPRHALNPVAAFGYRINQLRREKKLTLEQVANALGVSKPTVWAWEKGKARPLPERLEAIAKVLGVEPFVLGETGASNRKSSVIEECRLRIATEYERDPNSIRITIEL